MTDSFKDFEHQRWQESADPYHRYFSALTSQTIDHLLAAVAEQPTGKALLDLATGPGSLAQRAASLGFAPITGLDFSSAMIELARKNSGAVDFRLGDAEQIDAPDAAYDAVTMNFGLLHLEHPERAIAEAYRVLKPGGKFGFTVWAEPSQCAGFGTMLSAIDRFADKSAATLPAGPPFFQFSAAATSIAALRQAGFKDNADVEDVPMIWHLESSEQFYEAFRRGTARTGAILRFQSEAILEKIRAAVIADTKQYQNGDKLLVPMRAVMSVGVK